MYWWEDGALAAGSSGAPLLEQSTGTLRGIYTNAVAAGAEACSEPGLIPAQDRFTAISSILDFLPDMVQKGSNCVGHFDPDEGGAIAATVEDSNYYGPGVVYEISATEEVWLIDGFFADEGSSITITVGAGP